MSMEQNGNQNLASPIFCRNGCGFYAAQAFDGMCSKCFKDLKQGDSPVAAVQSPATTPSISRSSVLGAGDDDVDAVAVALSKTSLSEMNMNTSSNSGDKFPEKLGAAGGSELETASPTVATAKASCSDKEGSRDDVADSASTEGDSTSDGDKGKKPKKNRCMECRKKVGLTGFVCHCGKLFCSLHRYSDTHECTFDFKEKGQEEIRKNNPVIKGEKIQKI